MNYGTIPNDNGGKNGEALTAKNSFKSGIDPKNLYRTDTQTRDQFPLHVGTPNPAWNYLHQGSSHGEWDVHPQQYINKFKVCEIQFNDIGIPFQYIAPSTKDFGNWRYGSIKVDENVLLMTDSQSISGGFDHQVGKAFDGMKPGFLNQVEGALELARLATSKGADDSDTGGKFISRYREVPVWQGTTPNAMGDIKFNFEFGMAGIYSGEHEVVRPIFALASLFTPKFQGANYLKGPAPTDASYFAEMVSTLVGKVGGMDIKDVMKDVGTALTGGVDKVVELATDVQKAIYGAIDQGIKSAAKKGPLYSIYIRYGRFVTGPYFVGGVHWDLDFSEVDEYGFPYKGTITLGGLKSLWVATSADFIKSFDPA
jgi:hypothetical protein